MQRIPNLAECLQTARLLAAKLTRLASPEEEKELRQRIEGHPGRKDACMHVLEQGAYERHREAMKQFPPQEGWKRISSRLGRDASERVHPLRAARRAWAVCAAIILLLLLPAGYLVLREAEGEHIHAIVPGKTGGELTLADGTTLDLATPRTEKMPQSIRIDAHGIRYDATEIHRDVPPRPSQTAEPDNTLRTRHGMECLLTLADGTEIHLNANTQLTYPVCFTEKERVVHLEGEARFNVAPDTEHPFIVYTPHTTIRVTGTSFNVRAYADEPTESTTLSEGSVTLLSGEERFDMTAGQRFEYNKTERTCRVDHVNTRLHTSWAYGSFIFRDVPLEEVMSYLSKWNDFRYTFEDADARQVRIGAHLNRYENMNPVIDMIKKLNLVDIRQKDGVLHISLLNKYN